MTMVWNAMGCLPKKKSKEILGEENEQIDEDNDDDTEFVLPMTTSETPVTHKMNTTLVGGYQPEDGDFIATSSTQSGDDDHDSLTELRDSDQLRKATTPNVWSPGDHCLSPWSGDKKYFPGTIKSIKKNPGTVLALVSYNDYSSEEDEEIDVKHLKKIATRCKQKAARSLRKDHDSEQPGFFKLLDANIESQRLHDKYGSYSDDEIEKKLDSWFAPKIPSSTMKAKKLPVACGGKDLPEEKTRRHRIQRSQRNKSDQSLTNLASQADDEEPVPSTSKHDILDDRNLSSKPMYGFDEEDMEKPKFSFPPSGTKVPFLLSEIGSNSPIQVPATINQYLRDYQREGIKFLYSHYKQDRGAILGDDMGLGKTVQVIGFLAAILQKSGNRDDVMHRKPLFIRQLSGRADLLDDLPARPLLIIGPGSVLYNWIDEFDTWGYFTVGKYHGSEKQQCLLDLKKNKLDVVITTFETFRENQDDLNSVEWEAVIADEVHKIKGLKAQTTRALRTLRVTRRYGLTGTPLQNTMKELWSILDWAQPGCCGNIVHFEEYFVNVIEKGQRHDATKGELAVARKRKEEFSAIREKIMIRRMKSLIADQLPKKDDNVVFCKLSELQTSVYRTILEQPDVQIVFNMDDLCDCGSGNNQSRCCYKHTNNGRSVQSVFFSYLHLLLKTANHVALLIPHSRTSETQSLYAKHICDIVFENYPQFVSQAKEAAFKTLSDPKYCGKMKILRGLLSVFHKEHAKVLVFSYSTKLLDIMEQYLMTTGYEYRRLDGSTSIKKRFDIVREFNKDPNIFICLVSTKAGGLGLNLTGANKVVIFDPNWNPTHDLQAQDRAYRIGQSRNVQVFRLVSAGTIEENIYLRQIYKQQLDNVAIATGNAKRYFHGIQGDKHHRGELFGAKNMFQLRTGESCLTLDILQRNQKVETGLTGFKIAKYIPSPSVTEKDNGEEREDQDLADEEADSAEDLDIFADLFSPNVRGDDSDVADTVDRSNKDSCKYSIQPNSNEGGARQTETIKEKKSASVNTKGLQARSKCIKSVEKKSVKQRPKTDNDSISIEKKESSMSYTSVAAVLDTCNVLHVHENRRVVGASKAEDHMSRCALQEVYELHQNSQIPALQCDPLLESSDEEPHVPALTRRGRKGTKSDHNTPRTQVVGKLRVLVGQTPKAIKHQQFQRMCEFLGKDSLTSLAEYIYGSSVHERLRILDQFYQSQDPQLQGLLHVEKEKISDNLKSTKKYSFGTEKKHGPGKGGILKSAHKRSTKRRSLFGANYYLSDSEAIESQQMIDKSCLGLTEDDIDIMEVGKPPSPTPSRRKSTRYIRPRLRGKQGFSKVKNIEAEDLFYLDLETNSVERSDRIDQRPMELTNTDDRILNLTTEHTDLLLDEIGINFETAQSNQQEQEALGAHHCDRQEIDSRLNLLDNIFLGANDDTASRKPPPCKVAKLQKDNSQKHCKKSAVSVQLDEIFSESHVIEHQVLESTLKEDSLDCFNDPSKWRKKHKKRVKPVSTVDRLISEGNVEYKNLFIEGKLTKRDKTKSDSPSNQEACVNDQSLSLF